MVVDMCRAAALKDASNVVITSPITWHGAKTKLASTILRHFPEHRTYCEPFGGSAAVLLAKEPSEIEIYNDADRSLVNLFRVVRDPSCARSFGERWRALRIRGQNLSWRNKKLLNQLKPLGASSSVSVNREEDSA